MNQHTTHRKTSVLITGGNKGLGFEAARRLGEQGWTIFLGSRDKGRGRAAVDKLAAGGANVILVPLDVTSDESVADAVRLAREHTNRLDVLIKVETCVRLRAAPVKAPRVAPSVAQGETGLGQNSVHKPVRTPDGGSEHADPRAVRIGLSGHW